MYTYGDKNIKHNQISNNHNNNHNFECLCFMLTNHHICVVLWSSVRHIGSWNFRKTHAKIQTYFIVKYNIVYVLKPIHLGWRGSSKIKSPTRLRADSNLPNIMHAATKVHVILKRCVVLTWKHNNKESV